MAKAIMVQGTTSNAGKSFTVAGLCRILKQNGFRVAPFKSQNMALNSFVTADGLEMGRAQVMQAEAAGIMPDVRMNPILLKPAGETGSQVVVNGTPLGHMKAKEYYQKKQSLRPIVQVAYDSLAAEYDVIVIEGAGSPAEINLKRDDFVNMGMAKMANAPVLLVGDIDLGGVFASLYGTLSLLEPDERSRVKGLIVNKFRGDIGLFESGRKMLEDLTRVPVLGVVPYMKLDLDDEDSLSDRLTQDVLPQAIDIAVIRLPRLSNFTDFNPLMNLQDVSLRYVDRPEKLGRPDVIILPGTKGTMDDLLWLRETGLASRILRHAGQGGMVIGICGGFQILGQTLSDPHAVERGGEMDGLGLLNVRTVFAQEKTRKQVSGTLPMLADAPYEGYEIHMGETAGETWRGSAWGTYIHGLFDRSEVVQALLDQQCQRKGIPPLATVPRDIRTHKEMQYDLLAAGLRDALDMKLLYEILERGARA